MKKEMSMQQYQRIVW